MSIIFWNTNALAKAIAERRVSPNEKFLYLLLGNCMYAAAGYAAWLFVTPPSGWLFWYEGLLVMIVTYFGVLRCRERYEGASDDRLLENCVMLGLPIGLKLLLFTWIAHATVGWGMQWIVTNLTLTEGSPIRLVNFLLGAIHKFYAFLITAVGTGLYYLRMSAHLETIATSAETFNPTPTSETMMRDTTAR
jgi:hypothetical protein